MHLMQERQSNTGYLASFEQFEKSLIGESASSPASPSGSPLAPLSASPLHALRREAIARFAEVGFPTVREEEWRFTNVTPIARAAFFPAPVLPAASPLPESDIRRLSFAGPGAHRILLLNGVWQGPVRGTAPLPVGVRVESMREAIRQGNRKVTSLLGSLAGPRDNAFTALNAAFLQEGVVVLVDDDASSETPLEILHVARPGSTPVAAFPRTLVVVGRNARLSMVETYVAAQEGSYLSDVVTEIFVGEGAIVEHERVQLESIQAYHVGTLAVRQDRASTFISNALSMGAALGRNTVGVVLSGEGAECTLNGLSLATGEQLLDNHTAIDHAAPHCTSHELYKAILDGAARGVFNGKIFVRAGAQKTDAKQTNKTLLLSDAATINTKPQLEIFADDVKCTHGATVGQLSEEQLFYLRARGIGEEAARELLTFAFASDVVARIHIEPLREQLDRLLRDRLRHGRTQSIL